MCDHILDQKVDWYGVKHYVDLGDSLEQVKEEVARLSAGPEWGGADAREIWARRACCEQERDCLGQVRLGHDSVDDLVNVEGLDVAHMFGSKMLVQNVDALGVRLPTQRQNG